MVRAIWTDARRSNAWFGSLLLVSAAGCKPDLEGRPSMIDSPRVLAIRSQPAEAAPGDVVTYDALVAGPSNGSADLQLDWALCHARKPLAEPGPVATTCLQPTGPDLEELGASTSAVANIPSDVCQVFGPVTPVQKPGEPIVRPADPDTTGGYYQPVRLLTGSDEQRAAYDVGVTRVGCGIPLGASQENTVTFARQYHSNANPMIDRVRIDAGDGAIREVDPATGQLDSAIKPGSPVRFEVSWSACPLQPSEVPCTGAEAYVNYDAAQQTLQQRRESLRVSWFATTGVFENDRTGRSEQEADTPSTSNVWTAPTETATVRFWLVIRDDRRGVGWSTFELEIP